MKHRLPIIHNSKTKTLICCYRQHLWLIWYTYVRTYMHSMKMPTTAYCTYINMLERLRHNQPKQMKNALRNVIKPHLFPPYRNSIVFILLWQWRIGAAGAGGVRRFNAATDAPDSWRKYRIITHVPLATPPLCRIVEILPQPAPMSRYFLRKPP